MRSEYDAVIVGGGHNGLVTAAYLAGKGVRTLVLERRDQLGGACVTEEVFPGYRVSTMSYVSSLLRPAIVRDLDLRRHGFELLPLDPGVFVPMEDGTSLGLWDDPVRTREEIAKFSKRDADAYERFEEQLGRIAGFLDPLFDRPPPDPFSNSPRDLAATLRFGMGARSLGREDFYALMRLMTMSVGDYLDELFESDAVKSAFAPLGVLGASAGPSTPGTAYGMLHLSLGAGDTRGETACGFVKGGMGSITEAMAASARERGVETRTGADVAEIRVLNGRVLGVTLASGEEIDAPVVASNADPQRTFSTLVDRREIDAGYLQGIDSLRISGTSAKVHLALSALPEFTCMPDPGPTAAHTGETAIAGSIANLEAGWNATKAGQMADRPFCELTFPTVVDSSLAPEGKHLMSAFVQYTPYDLAEGDWDLRRGELGDRVIDTIAEYAPNIRDVIEDVHVLTPLDMEREYGLTRGNLYHGDLIANQLFTMRPVVGWANYQTPISGLYLCGAGTHPGGGVMGAPGRNAANQMLKDGLWKKHR